MTMTEDHYKRLVAMLLDTVAAQAAQIEALLAQTADAEPQELMK